jgi:hypothetical protein
MILTYATLSTLILSLGVWTFFYMFGAPLSGAESIVVVGVCGLCVYGVQSLFRRLLGR